ncbi:GTPase IMAP family member 4 [Patella vulgata]|uniref:GTPase IMAP family member 4 n=1 Tax=Patella vulgata TaxID=6465 RepID=UPI002180497A|nr:GTPase IMAP family member 4 [Patella vulgata]XP_050407245.1 GTPase IMAP family member 4 [Patella vulgata]
MSDFLPLRCVVIGKIGVGKSSLCNFMAKSKVCKTDTSASSVTINPQKVAVQFNEKQYEFIDFPGYFDTCQSDDEIEQILGRGVELSRPGPHVFAYVISIASRFLDDDKHTLLKLTEKFGYEVFNYMVVIFTCENNLRHSNQSPEQYVVNLKSKQGQNPPKHIKYLIDALDEGRYAFVECYGTGNESRSDAFAVIDQLKAKNGEEHYTNEMYEKAVEMKRQEELKRKIQEELERFREEREGHGGMWRRIVSYILRDTVSAAISYVTGIVGNMFTSSQPTYRTVPDVNQTQQLSTPRAGTCIANPGTNVMATLGAPSMNRAQQNVTHSSGI